MEHQPSFPGTAGVRCIFLGATAARGTVGSRLDPAIWGASRGGDPRDGVAIPTRALGEDLAGGGILFFWDIWQS